MSSSARGVEDRRRAQFVRALLALGPYLAELVVAGGWAQRLFRLRPEALPVTFAPLMTDDADVVAHDGIRARRESIHERLLAAGFVVELTGQAPTHKETYAPQDDLGAFHLEFIAPGGTSHGRSSDSPLSVAGIAAQRLSYVGLLLLEPWTVRLTEAQGYAVGARGLEVRIPNAVCYLVQKVLKIQERHATPKRGKDVLYVFDTFAQFQVEDLATLWQRLQTHLNPRTLERLAAARRTHFGSVSDACRSAAEIAVASGRPAPPTPERIAQTCRAGFDALGTP